MKKIISLLILLVLLTACNAPIATPAQSFAAVNTALPTTSIQFTPIPTATLETQPTANFPTFAPPTAQTGQATVIQFAVGGTYTDITDTVLKGTNKTYSINAMKGQIMSISAFPQIPDGDWGYIYLQIKGADGSVLCPQAPDTACLYWRGILPASQNYFVTVTTDGNVPKFIMRVAVNPPGKDNQYFQYKNPTTGVSLTYPDTFAPAIPVYGNYKIQPELTLQLIDSKTYGKTNLGEAYLFLSSSSDAQVVATCVDPNQNGGGSEQVIGNEVVNGFTFVHSTSEGAGAGNFYQQEIYRMVNKNICYEVIYFMHSTNVGNYTPGTVTEFDKSSIVQKFSNIFSTFAIQ